MPEPITPVDKYRIAAFDVRTKYPIQDLPDDHPFEKRDNDPDVFTYIRVKESELPKLWKDTEEEQEFHCVEWDDAHGKKVQKEQDDIFFRIKANLFQFYYMTYVIDEFGNVDELEVPIPDDHRFVTVMRMVPVHRPLKKLDLEAHKAARVKVAHPKLDNLYTAASLTLVDGTLEEYTKEVRRFDTGENEERTVGTGKDHSTMNLGYTAVSSGDVLRCFETTNNHYLERLTLAKTLDIIGTVANRGITIQTPSGSSCIQMDPANRGGKLINFTLDAVNSTHDAVYLRYRWFLIDCTVINADRAGVYGGGDSYIINCLAHHCTTGFLGTGPAAMLFSCTAGKCTYGFNGAGANDPVARQCVAAGSVTADFNNCFLIGSSRNWSGDGTAPGSAPSINLTTAIFTDYDGDDFSIDLAEAPVTYGEPEIIMDGAGNERKNGLTDNVVYPGYLDPDPAGAVTPTFAGITGITDNGDGSVTVSFTEGTDAARYLISLDTSAINGAALAADTYLACATDHTGTASRAVRIWNQPGTTSKLVAAGAAAVTWYGAMRAISSTGTMDSNTVNEHTDVSNTETTGPNWSTSNTQGTALQINNAAYTTVHTGGAGKTTEIKVEFHNTNAATRTLEIHRVPSGDSEGNDTLIGYITMDAKGGALANWTIWEQLGPGDKITAKAGTDATSITSRKKLMELTR